MHFSEGRDLVLARIDLLEPARSGLFSITFSPIFHGIRALASNAMISVLSGALCHLGHTYECQMG